MINIPAEKSDAFESHVLLIASDEASAQSDDSRLTTCLPARGPMLGRQAHEMSPATDEQSEAACAARLTTHNSPLTHSS